jgi:hypothetical protein
MSKSTYFVQECPTCGRALEIRVEYLGREVLCQHCRGHFICRDPAGLPATAARVVDPVLRRAEELLQMAQRRAASGI